MIQAREDHVAVLLSDGRVLVAGGWAPNAREYFPEVLTSTELYDPSTNSWSPTTNMSKGRKYHSGVPLGDGRVLVVGGLWSSSMQASSEPLASAEIYDASTDS